MVPPLNNQKVMKKRAGSQMDTFSTISITSGVDSHLGGHYSVMRDHQTLSPDRHNNNTQQRTNSEYSIGGFSPSIYAVESRYNIAQSKENNRK